MVDEVGTVKGLRDYGVKEDIAHAKPRPGRGADAGRKGVREREFCPAVAGHAYAWIGEEMAHAKPRRGSGRKRGPQRPEDGWGRSW